MEAALKQEIIPCRGILSCKSCSSCLNVCIVNTRQGAKMKNQELTEKIIGCAMKVHSKLGPGFLESVYQKALGHELNKLGLEVEREKQIEVH